MGFAELGTLALNQLYPARRSRAFLTGLYTLVGDSPIKGLRWGLSEKFIYIFYACYYLLLRKK